MNMKDFIHRLLTDESAQGLPEYALLCAAVVLAVLIAAVPLSAAVKGLFTDLGDYLDTNDRV
jgi:Flp pilus assembly pilin Flp